MSAKRGRKPKAIVAAAMATVEMGAAQVKPLGVKGGRLQYQRVADAAILEIRQRSAKEGGATHLVNVTAHPLDWYWHRRRLSRDQFDAGERLRSDFVVARRPGFKTTSAENFGGCYMPHDNWRTTNKQAEAIRRITVAMEAMSRTSRLFLERVICRGEWANDVARRAGYPDRFGIDRLRESLDDLHHFYARPPALRQRLLSSPEIDAERRRVVRSPSP